MTGLQVRELTVVYPGRPPVTAVDSVSLEVGKGEVVALLGPSGCGKSSLLGAIVGVVEPARGSIAFDAEGRVRVDDWEMRPEIQDAISDIWPKVTTENLEQLTDIKGYRSEFLKMFGFGLGGVDYEAEVEPHHPML